MTSEPLIQTLRAFMAERDWQQFHSPENLAKSINIEAGELLECYQWNSDADREEVAGELEAGTRRSYREFSRCSGCGRVYWRGAHSGPLETVVRRAEEVVARAVSG